MMHKFYVPPVYWVTSTVIWHTIALRKKNAFKASHKNTRTYYFIADSDEDKQRWMDKMLLASILYDESDKESGYGTAGTGASPVATELCKSDVGAWDVTQQINK